MISGEVTKGFEKVREEFERNFEQIITMLHPAKPSGRGRNGGITSLSIESYSWLNPTS
jgi:hypothetical protein